MSAKGDESQAIGDDFEATIFADYFIDFLEKGILTGIYLKDERFGNVDDIVFELNKNILHCIQAKGSKSYREITLSYLFRIPKDKEKSFLQNLYESFINLKKYFKNYLIRIEFITSRFPSSSTRSLPKDDKHDISLASFIRQVWRPLKSGRISKDDILKDSLNEKFIEKFREHLGITLDDLWDFFKCFNFKFNYFPIRSRSEYESLKIEKYYNWYLKTKKNPEINGYIPVDRLLREFGISITPNPHDFPIEKELYVSFPEITNNIIKGITELEKGYIFLKGGPSTGKSTFLEAEFQTRNTPNYLIFKYLCFREPNELSLRSRGEFTHLLEDLNEQFRIYIKFISTQNTRERFIKNLHEISEFAKKENKKVVIIIDGIDHVTREELDKLDKPLTNHLLRPDSLPINIIFLIAGQHFQSITWYNSLKDTDLCKNYEIKPFSMNQIKEFLVKFYKYQEQIEFQVIEKLFNKTQGNPRYLNLICQKFDIFEELNKGMELVNEKFLDFEKDWNDLYEKYWISFGFENNINFKNIAGLISRIIGPIDLIWLKSWLERSEIEKFIIKFDFCFKRYSNILLFDHNSFKSYLQKKTISFAGMQIEKEGIGLFNKLASRCDIEGLDSYCHWFRLRYLKNAGKIGDFEINREYFIQQWLQGRILSDIIEDIRLLLEYYISNKSIETTFKVIFLKLEFELREAINKLDTKPDYIFLINPVFEESRPYLYYLVSVVLRSLDISPSFKLDFISSLFDKFDLRKDKDLYLLIKNYFKTNKQNWIEVYNNPDYDESFTKKWLKVALFFDNNADKVIQEYNSFLIAKQKDYLLQAERGNYYSILWTIGKFLIENSRIDSMKIIYDILIDLIEQDEWEIISNENILFKNKYRPIEFYAIARENPFHVLLNLKFDESKINGKEIFDNFLEENSQFKILYDKSDIKYWYKFEYTNVISEEDLFYWMDYGFTVEKSYSHHGDIEIKNRFYLYQILNKQHEITEDKLISLFNKIYEKHKINSRITKDSIKFQWEKVFFELAICLDRPYSNLEESKPLTTVIMKLFEMLRNRVNYVDEHHVRIFVNFVLILDILIEKLAKYNFLHEWFQNTLFEFFKKGVYMFNSIENQVAIINLIQKYFKEVNKDLVKWVIINAKTNYSSRWIGYWNLSSTIYDILRVLTIVKSSEPDFYNNHLNIFLNILKIFSFRMYPRKDWQLYNLVYLLKNIISYFPQDDINFIENINWLVYMLNYVETITERSEISAVKELFHEAILSWNDVLAKEIYYRLKLHTIPTRDYISRERKEEIEIEDTFINDLTEVFDNPSEFLDKIVNFSEELNFEQDYYSKNYKKIIDKLEEKQKITFEGWTRFFEFLVKEGKDKSILDLGCSVFIVSFIKFYRDKINTMELNDSKIKDMELKIEIAQLRSPNSKFFHGSLKNLYNLDKEKCFEFGWQVISNSLVKIGKPILYIIYYDFLTYTFLPKINNRNYLNYWSIYLKYLQNLFRIMDF